MESAGAAGIRVVWQSRSGAEMTSCQTSHINQMPNDPSVIQTARKSAAARTVQLRTRGTLLAGELGAAAHSFVKAPI